MFTQRIAIGINARYLAALVLVLSAPFSVLGSCGKSECASEPQRVLLGWSGDPHSRIVRIDPCTGRQIDLVSVKSRGTIGVGSVWVANDTCSTIWMFSSWSRPRWLVTFGPGQTEATPLVNIPEQIGIDPTDRGKEWSVGSLSLSPDQRHLAFVIYVGRGMPYLLAVYEVESGHLDMIPHDLRLSDPLWITADQLVCRVSHHDEIALLRYDRTTREFGHALDLSEHNRGIALCRRTDMIALISEYEEVGKKGGFEIELRSMTTLEPARQVVRIELPGGGFGGHFALDGHHLVVGRRTLRVGVLSHASESRILCLNKAETKRIARTSFLAPLFVDEVPGGWEEVVQFPEQ